MPFKSSLMRSAGKLFGLASQRDMDLRGYTSSRWVLSYDGTATGGTITTPGNGYKYHFITADSQDFVVSGGFMQIDYILIAGGGGGGSYYPSGYTNGGKGTPSVFTIVGGSPVTAIGGGGGIKYNQPTVPTEANGGSGGGGGGSGSADAGAADNYPGPAAQGYPGGTGGSTDAGGGGGGAGAAGDDAPPTACADGGVGKAAFSGDTGVPPSYGTPGPSAGRWFGGGGGGGSRPSKGDGGAGGGGNGGAGVAGADGTTNTGGGGGGGDNGIGAGHGGGGAGGYAEGSNLVIGPGTHDIDIGPGHNPASPLAGGGGPGMCIIRYLVA